MIHSIKPKKRLGQNFLISSAILEELTKLIPLNSKIIEIGGGTGVITEKLLEKSQDVSVVEVDKSLANFLSQKFDGKINVLNMDFLKMKKFDYEVIVSAVPYYISKLFLLKLYDFTPTWKLAVLILQKEFVDKLLAKPGADNYRQISVLSQYAWQIQKIKDVPRESFYPRPKVDSVIIKLIPKSPFDKVEASKLKKVINVLFSYRNKTLKSTIKIIKDTNFKRLEDSLNNILLHKRIKELEVADFVEILHHLSI
ncbi:ribosomal RNA small subunit methyltransferase A [Candidatus Marsarchaeota G1 archaeon OSP_B]|jgi:16S rRNA (adenine1518-N6/adenine1519-N6)-dimethyltransferase|uniref:Ribosomal RNA small subunit methyltransferase A n=3 Tax=Candidatus Marsarchaeota TaxID=1978152 RepID=A0A2R6B8B8_9ARCH|nr:MAG: ribosomal RNA small subunit methyltransferase A [Candidatus Marsarchaeota G1 archaeon OSP_B]